jgi:nucleotide-binding universal stress UspA family protein
MLGCIIHHPKQPAAPPPLNYSYYRGDAVSWNGVKRVLVLPLTNETEYSHAAEEVRNALVTELQQLGRFEVIPGPPGLTLPSRFIRENGQFNELGLIEIAREFHADAIIMGTLTQFSPYNPVRMGIVFQVVAPGDGVVVSSVDGMWDSANPWIDQRARAYYAKYTRRRDETLTANLALDSPRLYQRFVCFEAAHILVDDPHSAPGLSQQEAQATAGAGGPGCTPGQPPVSPPPPPPPPGPGVGNAPAQLPAPLRDGGH